MQTRIHLLDEALANQIAAGEVVERPANAVKELVENALDAGAAHVRVEVERGGTQDIRVSDDGEGMSRADAELAVQRHATSKIRDASDLDAIGTLGFRGEALPSIASVSRFELLTRPRDAVAGTRIFMEGGADRVVRDTGCAPGTSVRVHDLFFNVPARRKFLKSKGTEAAHVSDVVRRAALAFPGCRFTLHRDGRRSFDYERADTQLARAGQVFVGETLRTVEGTAAGAQLAAMLAPPERARAGAGGLYLFVNRRPVKDAALARAVSFAFGSVLPPGRYPVGALFLSVDPADVDVNVHPQKSEVRFAQGRTLLDALTKTLAQGLGTQAWSGPANRGAGYWQKRLAGAKESDETKSAKPPTSDINDTGELGSDPWGLAGGTQASGPAASAPALSASATSEWATSAWAASEWATSGQAIGQAAGQTKGQAIGLAEGASAYGVMSPAEPPSLPMPTALATPSQPSLLAEEGFFGRLRVLGQARRMFIVCEGDDGIHILDQHAVDERIQFDRLRRSYEKRAVATQRLLTPERVEVSDSEAALIEEHGDALLAMGLEVSLIGERRAAVHGVPALVKRAPAERLLRDVLGELSRTGERAFSDAVDMALATMACHGSIRGGDRLSLPECEALLRRLDEVKDFGRHCPHGRPVLYRLDFGELERRLHR